MNQNDELLQALTPLPLANWEDSKITLHLYLQIVGKIRLALYPKMNHWWHVTFYPTPTGLSTGPIPYHKIIFSLTFDFIDHVLLVKRNDNKIATIKLGETSIAKFYQTIMATLNQFEIEVSILAKPFDPSRVMSDIPFADDVQHGTYDKNYISQYWKILRAVFPIFAAFRGKFLGKSTPVHLFWHTLDLVVTRFSGNRAPKIADMDSVSREAYSHEVISFGLWPGDRNITQPAFYSYTFPEPERLTSQQLKPSCAFWQNMGESNLAIMKYHDWLKQENRKKTLFEFLQSAYLAGAKLANWPINELYLR